MYPHNGVILWLCRHCIEARTVLKHNLRAARRERMPSPRDTELLDLFERRAMEAVCKVLRAGPIKDLDDAAAWAEEKWT